MRKIGIKTRWWMIYKDQKGEYRVKARASNGRTVFVSSEGYRSRFHAVANAELHGAPCGLHNQPLGVELRYPEKLR